MTAFPVRSGNPTELRRRLRGMMMAQDVAVLPGPFDAASAILIAQLGFEGLWAGGYVGSASTLGVGDLALMSMPEQLRFSASIAEATGLPVVADCDDGYGGPLQVARTVQAFERAGMAGMVIEDQAAPKHCAFYDEFPLRVIDKRDMVAKIHAALDVRWDAETMIWARTDVLAAGMGVDETLDRAHAYAEAGADAIFAPCTKLHELAAYAAQWDRPEPLVMSGTAFLDLTIDEVKRMGFSLRSDAFAPILAALKAVEEVMGEYLRTGTLAGSRGRSKPFRYLEELVGTPLAADLERRYHAVEGVAGAATR